MTIFVENPLPLIFGTVSAGVILFGLYYQRQQKTFLAGAVAAFVLAVAFLALDLLVVTPVEQVEENIRDVTIAVFQKDQPRLIKLFSPDYNHDGVTYDTLDALTKRFMAEFVLTGLRLTGQETKAEGERIESQFTVWASGDYGGLSFSASVTAWKFTWEEVDGTWLVTKIEALSKNAQSYIGKRKPSR